MIRPLPTSPSLQKGAHSAAQVSSPRKTLVACSLGNALEMYDFTIYSFFAVVIAVNLLVDVINGYLNPRVSHGR